MNALELIGVVALIVVAYKVLIWLFDFFAKLTVLFVMAHADYKKGQKK